MAKTKPFGIPGGFNCTLQSLSILHPEGASINFHGKSGPILWLWLAGKWQALWVIFPAASSQVKKKGAIRAHDPAPLVRGRGHSRGALWLAKPVRSPPILAASTRRAQHPDPQFNDNGLLSFKIILTKSRSYVFQIDTSFMETQSMPPPLTKAAHILEPLSCGHLFWWHSRQ